VPAGQLSHIPKVSLRPTGPRAARRRPSFAERLLDGQRGVLIGLIDNAVAVTPLEVVAASKKALDVNLLALARVLAK